MLLFRTTCYPYRVETYHIFSLQVAVQHVLDNIEQAGGRVSSNGPGLVVTRRWTVIHCCIHFDICSSLATGLAAMRLTVANRLLISE